FAGCAQAGTGEERAGDTTTPAATAGGTASPGVAGSEPPTGPQSTTGGGGTGGGDTGGGGTGGGGTGGSTLKPPNDPTDTLPTDVLAGRIKAVGTGCYTLETDEGMTYALYGASGQTLKAGDTVRVTFEPLRTEVERCPGNPVQIVKITKVG